jgi:putative membrane protein insertion efficiency factor
MGGATVLARALILVIRSYQVALSPLLPAACRFTPTCSAYAAEAIEKYGAAKGSALAARRLARCHPWGGSGPDPVP